ncbi:MAG TPA: serine/threonine protein kinase, partial [Deltaproteobacteria bacterium]|nr:serine/threonine protein kinase [Deltaproteobacteria bacterium]
AYSNLGLLDSAEGEYKIALKLNPDSLLAHNNLGVVYAKKGDVEKAIIEFQEALRIDPSYSGARDNLNRALSMKG